MKSLRILMIEDVADDALLIQHELASSLQFECQRVETPDHFRATLQAFSPDIVLSDYSLPSFTAEEALQMLKEESPHVPFVLVTGSQSEEVAAECMRQGAADYVLKTSLTRLPAAVLNALARRRAEHEKEIAIEALRRSEQQYRLITENTRDLISVTDLEGNFLYTSPSFYRTLGYSPESLSGTNSFDLVHPQDKETAMQKFRRALRQAESFISEFRCRDSKNKWHTFEASASWILNESGAPQKAVFVSRDVTQSRQLEQQLHTSQRIEAIGRLAGGIAHDFNNLLSVILGYSEMMSEKLADNPALQENAEHVKTAALRAASVTRQLLAFSRRQIMELKIIDLNAIVADLTVLLRHLLGENIRIEQSFEPKLRPLRADSSQMEQMAMNLILNSRDAMPHGGDLKIETSNVDLDEVDLSGHPGLRPGPYIRLSVSDTGIGMDEETKSRIFEPFFTTKQLGQGTGLGLATVHGIVEQSGGYIAVHSEVNRGTTFQVYLPQASGSAERSGSRATESLKGGRGSETVLVVEDEQLVRHLATEILKRAGYRVLEAGDGDEALRIGRSTSGPIHLVLSDAVLPGMDGLEVAEQMSILHREAKVLFISGYSHDVLSQQDLLLPGATVLQKPFSASALRQRIREVLDDDNYVPWSKRQLQ